MEPGNIVEYIDQQKIICAVVTDMKKQRLRLLTETNREVNLSAGRLTHGSRQGLDLSMGRDSIVTALRETAGVRCALRDKIDLKELWELLNEEAEWIDIKTMAEYCFAEPLTGDHESAIVRAFFENRLYFKFNHDKFLPNTPKQVELSIAQAKEAERRARLIEDGADWVKKVLTAKNPKATDENREVVKILKDCYLFEKESRHFAMGKQILEKAGLSMGDKVFDLLVKLGEWDEHENLLLHRHEIDNRFSTGIMDQTARLVTTPEGFSAETERRDLTYLPLITIDGQSTRDYDDALSIEKVGDRYILGVHIIDVAHFIKKQDPIDREALFRASTIYMPDDKIPMLPAQLSEDLCSLKAGELRPGISILVTLTRLFEVVEYEIVPSTIRVQRQMSYTEVNKIVATDEELNTLYRIGKNFREKRLDKGAVQITLPEVNVWLDESGEITVTKVDRESPSRMFVAELMIMANWMMARFLRDNNLPAIFRSQPEPKSRMFKGLEDSLFLNCIQRKHLNRAVLGHEAEHHSGLGLDAYVTATSPIRKYFDLITQRQIRSVLGLETPYSDEEIREMFHLLEQPMSNVGRIQYMRRRYWLLKYLEARRGEREEALVLDKRRDAYMVMLKEYMLECKLPAGGLNLKPNDLVQVVIQHADARKDLISIFMG